MSVFMVFPLLPPGRYLPQDANTVDETGFALQQETTLKIALYHGYELSGSGSNEYTRYLTRTLCQLGHSVSLICREPEPEAHTFIGRALSYTASGEPSELFRREITEAAQVTLHRLPETSCYPVYLKDKQRPGRVKAFPELTDAELAEYHAAMSATLARALTDERPDVLLVNHLVYQPAVAAEVCSRIELPFVIVPHGSAIEYTVKLDDRFRLAARQGLEACQGLIWVAREVRGRVLGMFPDLREKIDRCSSSIGVGTDTSLFKPLRPADRPAALEQLKKDHPRGGKSEALRQDLRQSLDAGRVEAITKFSGAYSQALPDDDLPQLLDRIPLDDEWIFFVGALTYGKGIQSLITAMPGILSRRPRARLVLVGSGKYREFLEALTHSLGTRNQPLFDELTRRGRDLEQIGGHGGLEDVQAYAADAERRELLFRNGPQTAERIHFLGRLDHSRLRHLFPCARLAVFPSVIKEASPLVFIEALANGVLPAGSYHSGLRDGLDDLRPLMPESIWDMMTLPIETDQRVSGLVEQVSGLLAPLETSDLSGELRQIAEERYDWKAIGQRIVESLERTIAYRP